MRGRIRVCRAGGGFEGGGGWGGGHGDDVVHARGLVVLGVGGHCVGRFAVVGRMVMLRQSSLWLNPVDIWCRAETAYRWMTSNVLVSIQDRNASTKLSDVQKSATNRSNCKEQETTRELLI